MKTAKKKSFNKPLKIWAIFSSIIIALLLVVNILATNVFYELICMVFGGQRAIFAEGSGASYVSDTTSKEDALQNAYEVTEKITAEGMVLLKNADNALPIEASAKVSVFGKNSVNLVYGASGSSGGDVAGKTLFDSLDAVGIEYNPTLKAFYEDDKKSGSGRGESNDDLDSGNLNILSVGETPYEAYLENQIPASYAEYNDAAIVVLSRVGGEGSDLPKWTLDDADRHYLELSSNEEEMLTEVSNAGFDKVIVVINSAATMELGFLETGALANKIDAAIVIGFPGATGIMPFGKILIGEVNPSGHTVDTYAADFTKDPTYNNVAFTLDDDGNSDTKLSDSYISDNTERAAYFVDYEEGIYVGYRYYETRGYTDGEAWYEENVVYPFGYGNSYSEFAWTMKDDSSIKNVAITKDGKYSVSVEVENVSTDYDGAGKDVIQLYATAPYTEGGIEKAHKVLVGFAKTEALNKGQSKVYTIEFDPYSLASYDYEGVIVNGGGYVLEAGNYTLHVAHNSHDTEFEIPFEVASNIVYDKDTHTDTSVSNVFSDGENAIDAQLYNGTLSRSNWEETWPESRTVAERTVEKSFTDKITNSTNANNTEINNPTTEWTLPTTDTILTTTVVDEEGNEQEVENPVKLKDLNGLPYNDKLWDTFLDQLSVKYMADLINNGGFKTMANDNLDLGIPETITSDGPTGFVNFMGAEFADTTPIYDVCSYCSQVLSASTWNVELVEELGDAIGEEAYWGDQRSDGRPYTGIYAPGANIHRSPFGGRTAEYFSEDSFLTGKMVAAEVTGMAKMGVVAFVKHFAVNDQETHRSANGITTWLTEQSLREIYLKAFEVAVKDCDIAAEEDGSAVSYFKGVMSSFNRLGTKWTGGDYRLLTQVLRNEWGFEGSVITDFNTMGYMNPKQMVYAGGDLNLTSMAMYHWRDARNATSAEDVTVIRNAAHNILFSVANSNAVNGEIIGYQAPVWVMAMYVVDGVFAVIIILWGILAARKVAKNKKKMKRRR